MQAEHIFPDMTSAAAIHGAKLRTKREDMGMSLEEASAQVRIPVRALAALESGRWEEAGAGVFVRGQLKSYGRLLGLDTTEWMQEAPAVEPPKLVTHQRTPTSQRFADEIGRKLVYVVLTLAIGVPVWLMATRSPVGNVPAGDTASLEVPSTSQTAAPAPASAAATNPQQPMAMASMTPVPQQVRSNGGITIRFNGESWMQAYGADGAVIEKGLVKPGETRNFAGGQLSRITLGNASQVQVERAGAVVDLTPYIRSDVARFAVSSDGTPGPASN